MPIKSVPSVMGAALMFGCVLILFDAAPDLARYLVGWLAFVVIAFLIWAFAMNVTWHDLGPNPPDWEDDWPDHP